MAGVSGVVVYESPEEAFEKQAREANPAESHHHVSSFRPAAEDEGQEEASVPPPPSARRAEDDRKRTVAHAAVGTDDKETKETTAQQNVHSRESTKVTEEEETAADSWEDDMDQQNIFYPGGTVITSPSMNPAYTPALATVNPISPPCLPVMAMLPSGIGAFQVPAQTLTCVPGGSPPPLIFDPLWGGEALPRHIPAVPAAAAPSPPPPPSVAGASPGVVTSSGSPNTVVAASTVVSPSVAPSSPSSVLPVSSGPYYYAGMNVLPSAAATTATPQHVMGTMYHHHQQRQQQPYEEGRPLLSSVKESPEVPLHSSQPLVSGYPQQQGVEAGQGEGDEERIPEEEEDPGQFNPSRLLTRGIDVCKQVLFSSPCQVGERHEEEDRGLAGCHGERGLSPSHTRASSPPPPSSLPPPCYRLDAELPLPGEKKRKPLQKRILGGWSEGEAAKVKEKKQSPILPVLFVSGCFISWCFHSLEMDIS